eukprot:5111116-Amphidinium_carterae.10
MHDYIKEKIRTLELPIERKRQPESDATIAEKDLFQTVLMKSMWVARQARPEISGSRALLTSKVKDLLELGRVVTYLKREPDLATHIQSMWRSGKIEMKRSSSLAAEAFALVQGVDVLSYLGQHSWK